MTTFRQPHRAGGFSSIWVAISLIVLIGFVALATDAGMVVLNINQMQNTADASALAGAQWVRADITQARQAARDIGQANHVRGQSVILDLNSDNAPNGDIVIGRFDRQEQTFTPTLNSPNAVRVFARRTGDSANGPLPLIFGATFGVPSISSQRDAIAMVGGGTGAGLITLNPDAPRSLEVRGSATLTVNDGDVQVNSSHGGALHLQNGVIDAPNVNVHGSYTQQGGQSNVTGNINEGAPVIPDPLAFLPDYIYQPVVKVAFRRNRCAAVGRRWNTLELVFHGADDATSPLRSRSGAISGPK